MKWHYLTVPMSVFMGAFAGFLSGHAALLTMATAKDALMGGVLAGVISVAHLYMPQPEPTLPTLKPGDKLP